jgi:hypothetical protein
MPHHENVKYSGVITEVFAHRFVLAAPGGAVLADIGPKGAGTFQLKKGDKVRIEGEQKPSEVKVRSIGRDGEAAIQIDHPKQGGPRFEHVDPQIALRAADKAGFDVIGEPQRKPKHFELRVKSAKGEEFELHIELDGHIRKQQRIEKA